MNQLGWHIRCPDGKVRHYPYINYDDAKFDAELCDGGRCQFYPEPNELERRDGRCAGGRHSLEPASLIVLDELD